MEMAERVFADIPNITVAGYTGLTVDYARRIGAKVMVRGLRVFSDFDYEFRMALANKKLAPDIETVSLITTLHAVNAGALVPNQKIRRFLTHKSVPPSSVPRLTRLR